MATAKQKELGAFLLPLTNLAMQMILAGTLKKNVIKHFTNKGLTFEASENIVECAVVKAENYQANKAK
jgi:hypothetical protein